MSAVQCSAGTKSLVSAFNCKKGKQLLLSMGPPKSFTPSFRFFFFFFYLLFFFLRLILIHDAKYFSLIINHTFTPYYMCDF